MQTNKGFKSIAAIKRANEEAGRYFFSPDSMKFFHSVVLNKVYKGQYFITSEKYDRDDLPKYTIRRIDLETHGINTIGENMGFNTVSEAEEEIERLPSP